MKYKEIATTCFQNIMNCTDIEVNVEDEGMIIDIIEATLKGSQKDMVSKKIVVEASKEIINKSFKDGRIIGSNEIKDLLILFIKEGPNSDFIKTTDLTTIIDLYINR